MVHSAFPSDDDSFLTLLLYCSCFKTKEALEEGTPIIAPFLAFQEIAHEFISIYFPLVVLAIAFDHKITVQWISPSN
jgi:hypothetical protein